MEEADIKEATGIDALCLRFAMVFRTVGDVRWSMSVGKMSRDEEECGR